MALALANLLERASASKISLSEDMGDAEMLEITTKLGPLIATTCM